MLRDEGGPGCERIVIPAASLSWERALTLLVGWGAALAAAAVVVRLVTEAEPVSLPQAMLFLGVVPLTLMAVLFGSESARILFGRETLSWEDVFLVHEMRLPWVTTTQTHPVERFEDMQVARVRSPHPRELALHGKRCLAIRTRDGLLRVGVGLPRGTLERLRVLAARHMTAARMRAGLRDP